MIDLGQIRDIETLRNVFFGVCDTYTGVATKIVTAPGYTPEEGKLLVVKFNYGVNLWDPTNEEWMRLYMNVNGSGAMYAETYTYTYTYPDGTERYYELMGDIVQTPVYAVFTYYEFSADDKGYRLVCTSGTLSMLGEIFDRISAMSEYISGKQDTLASGTNIKTVNGNSLLGSGDLSLSGKIFQGVTYSASSETTKVVTINTPANTTFEDGDLLFLRFYNDVAASVTGTIVSIGSKTYGIAYRNYGLQAAGVIKAGDNVLLHCFGGYAIIIAIDRWGADIASKQDALPPVANNAGKVLAVNNAANGLEWVAQQGITQIKTVNGQSMEGTGNIVTTPAYTHYYYTISDNTPLTITCPSGKRSHHTIVVQDYNGATAPTITINIQNLCDNEIVIRDSRRAITAFPVSVKFNGVDSVVLSKSDNGWGIVDESNSLFIYTKGLPTMLRMKAVPFNVSNDSHYVTVVGHLLETVYDPQQS